nr:MAG TPA: hypothetical protein [Caudoviricetes sp.]
MNNQSPDGAVRVEYELWKKSETTTGEYGI